MADLISDGLTKVSWALTCSSTGAPTAAEATAGVSLEAFITPDGLDISRTTAMVDTGALNSTQDSEVPGRRKDSVTLTFKHQGDANAPYTTFAPVAGVRPSGYLFVRYGVVSTTAFTAAQKVDVYPVQAGDRQRIKSAPNEVLKFAVPLAVNGVVQDSVALS